MLNFPSLIPALEAEETHVGWRAIAKRLGVSWRKLRNLRRLYDLPVRSVNRRRKQTTIYMLESDYQAWLRNPKVRLMMTIWEVAKPKKNPRR